MKSKLLSIRAYAFGILLAASPATLVAQDDPDRSPPAENAESPDESGEPEPEADPDEADPESGDREFTPEERERLIEELKRREKEVVDRMMAVFKPLAATWTGTEKLEFTDKRIPAKHWKDEWTGRYTFDGRYFEMDGRTEGDTNSSYRWICTWDAEINRYRAWYFGDSGANEYTGVLSGDGTHVVWRSRSRGGESTSEFVMKADGNRVECEGFDKLRGGTIWSRQTSTYVRKRIDL